MGPLCTKILRPIPSPCRGNEIHGIAEWSRGTLVGAGRFPATASVFSGGGLASWAAESEVLPVVVPEGAFGEAGSAGSVGLLGESGFVENWISARESPVVVSDAPLPLLDGRAHRRPLVIAVLRLFPGNALPCVVA